MAGDWFQRTLLWKIYSQSKILSQTPIVFSVKTKFWKVKTILQSKNDKILYNSLKFLLE